MHTVHEQKIRPVNLHFSLLTLYQPDVWGGPRSDFVGGVIPIVSGMEDRRENWVVTYVVQIQKANVSNALTCTTLSGRNIDEETAKGVYELFKTFFVNEYNTLSEFKAYLRSPQDLLLFYEKSTGALIGFIILRKNSYNIDNYFFRIVEAVCILFYENKLCLTSL